MVILKWSILFIVYFCFFVNPQKCMSASDRQSGTVKKIGGFKSYVSGSPHSKIAILVGSDVYGIDIPKFRKIVDKIAAAGFLAVAPDFFYGDPMLNSSNDDPNFDKEAWMRVHNADRGYKDAKKIIAALKKKGVYAVGAAGFCWGGKVALKLAGSNYIQAAVLLHPSRIVVEEIKKVKVPIAILWGELDRGLTPEQLKQFGQILSSKSKKFDSVVKIYPGVKHGWTLRYNDTDPFAIKKANEAHKDMTKWLTKHMK